MAIERDVYGNVISEDEYAKNVAERPKEREREQEPVNEIYPLEEYDFSLMGAANIHPYDAYLLLLPKEYWMYGEETLFNYWLWNVISNITLWIFAFPVAPLWPMFWLQFNGFTGMVLWLEHGYESFLTTLSVVNFFLTFFPLFFMEVNWMLTGFWFTSTYLWWPTMIYFICLAVSFVYLLPEFQNPENYVN